MSTVPIQELDSPEQILEEMIARLSHVVPEAELRLKAPLVAEINRLKQEKNALILGHNYMEPALFHTVPDFRGDSLELCRRAAQTDRDIIVFCGVKFMAETAKILNPDRKVLIPSLEAGCSLAESITAEDVRNLKRQFPGIPVVVYVNTYADVKAEADYCCTSSNAARVINAIDSDAVIFLPDEFLASNVASETGRTIIFPSRDPVENPPGNLKNVILGWKGRCEVHEKFTVQDIETARRQFPGVVVLAHPECPPEVVNAADFSGSTTAMSDYVKQHGTGQYLLLTECSMGDNIIAENPDRETIRLCSVRCPHMNEISLEQTRDSLLYERYEVSLPEDIRSRAELSIRRMLEL